MAVVIFSSFRSMKLWSPAIQPHLSMVRDKTRYEREKLRACHIEIDCRIKAGETDLSIYYHNGIPCVMNSELKNRNVVLYQSQI